MTETSLGSGVATQGGASYVPQVARALQTAPVIPPGAFPNGSSGTQFTAAPVTAGAIAGAQAIAVQFWQKAEAERQKAREEEAAAVLRQCQEEGGCGAEEGEENWIDPEKSILLTTRQAEAIATVMRQGPAVLELFALSGTVGSLSAFLADRLAEAGKAYLQGIAYGLELCYSAINSASKAEARCKLTVIWVEEPYEEKNRLYGWQVETCWGTSYKRKNSVHWTFPYCYAVKSSRDG